MGILQQPVQNKLSKLIGAEVRFDNLTVSILGGSIEARGMTVAGDDPSRPVLTVRRLRADISVPRALKREIVIKSLTIEAPVLSVVRRADGTTNLPKPIREAAEEVERAADPMTPPAPPAPGDDADAAGGTWKLEAQRALLVDGELHYRAEAPDGVGGGGDAGAHFAARPILAEVKSAAGGLDFTCIIESVSRLGDKPVDLGQAKFAGRADGVEDLSQLSRASIAATLDVGQELRAEVKIPSLRPPEGSVDLTGAVDTRTLLPFLPDAIARMLPADEPRRVELVLRTSFAQGMLTVREFSIRAQDLRVNLKRSP